MRGRLTYSNVMSTVAVVIAIGGGTAFAAIELGKNSVRSRHIAPGAVKAPDIARKAVKRNKIANGAVSTSQLAAGAVTTGILANDAVTTSKLNGGAVEEGKLAPNLRGKINVLQRGGLVRFTADPGTQDQAAEHDLVSRGPFRIYAKCWTTASTTTGQAYVATTQPGALASGTIGAFNGAGGNYLNPDSAESSRRFASFTAQNQFASGSLAGSVTALHGSTMLQVGVSGWARGADLSTAPANYGNSRCIFSTYLIAASG